MTAYLAGGGIASLTVAVFLIRDAGIAGPDIHILEELPRLGGALDGAGDPMGSCVAHPLFGTHGGHPRRAGQRGQQHPQRLGLQPGGEAPGQAGERQIGQGVDLTTQYLRGGQLRRRWATHTTCSAIAPSWRSTGQPCPRTSSSAMAVQSRASVCNLAAPSWIRAVLT
jgi:hypothetical protein